MKLSLPKITWPSWTRNESGENFYDMTAIGDWTSSMSNLELAQKHPILTPAILFVSKLFSQAEFSVVRNSTGKEIAEHDLLKILRKPNNYQTREDFLETLMFIMIAQGVAVVYSKKIIGFDNPESLFVLNYDLIEWPSGFNEESFRSNKASIMENKIIYDKDGENISIKIKDLLFFYDLPNMMHKNPFKVVSRIEGLRQTLINTLDSMVAKNIILKSNGKELITGKKESFPLGVAEKRDIENIFNSKLGLSFSRKRGVVTQADLTWKSMHIALRDLGLDESVKVDGNLIYTALHIPKDILSLEAKKTTYNNFKESMVSYVQNEMQSSLNSAVAVFNRDLDLKYTLKGSFEHLPIMQFILKERYEVITLKAGALKALLLVGVPEEDALRICGFDSTMQLNELKLENNGNEQGKQTESQPPTS